VSVPGGVTTFSAFLLEVVHRLDLARRQRVPGHVLASVPGCVLGAAAGWMPWAPCVAAPVPIRKRPAAEQRAAVW